MTSQSPLFSPYAIRGVTLRNRIMVSPMAQYSAVDGAITDWHFAHFAKFAMGGAGLVFTEATKVERRGMGTVGDMGIWNDEHIGPLRRITSFLRQQGAVSGMQLNHAGRKAGTFRPWEGFGPIDRSAEVEGQKHWPVIGPSAVAHADGWPIPQEMTMGDVKDVVEAWGQAARRALEANFDILEIHGAHGYLIHQFLSPAANRRNDGYGGSFLNRIRFALEVTNEVRRFWPVEKPLFFRVSAQDDAGWDVDDTIALARELKAVGVDAIDCSSGGISGSPTASLITRQLGYQVQFAERVRREAGIASIAVGMIVRPKQAEAIIRDEQADLVAIGREMLYDPFWSVHAAKELGVDKDFSMMPPQYGWWLDRRAKSGYIG